MERLIVGFWHVRIVYFSDNSLYVLKRLWCKRTFSLEKGTKGIYKHASIRVLTREKLNYTQIVAIQGGHIVCILRHAKDFRHQKIYQFLSIFFSHQADTISRRVSPQEIRYVLGRIPSLCMTKIVYIYP